MLFPVYRSPHLICKPFPCKKTPNTTKDRNDHETHCCIDCDPDHDPTPTASIMLAVASWLRTRRSRFLFFLLCSPILLPFLCATFPILCVAEVCVRIFRRARRKAAAERDSQEAEDRLRRCEEGRCVCGGDRIEEERAEEEVGLLQRYLEDQLLLVRSVYECGDEFDKNSSACSGGGSQCGDFLVVESVDCKTPLLG